MKNYCIRIIVVFIFLFSSLTGFTQKASVIKLEQLNSLLSNKNDTTYVINFWATWCKPCVKELPFFIEAEERLKNEKVSFIFISLDFKRDLDSRLNDFVKKNMLNSTVYLIDEPDYDQWIDKVDPSWQGNIPATLIYNFNKSKREFFPKELGSDELSFILKGII